MLAEGLSTRYEFGGEPVGDAILTRTAGRRLEDGRDVCLVVFGEAAGVGQPQAVKAVESAAALARLGLPMVLAMLEAGRDEDGRVYMAFETSDMPTLKSVIKERGGLSPAEALDVIHAVAWTLGRTTGVGVDHLDLTSSTIHCNLLTGEPLKVRIDGFGLAGMLPSYNPTRKNVPYFGNAEYMAPEICSGRPGNSSSDLYALGILLYEMVAGKPPFVSAGASTTIKRQVYEKPLPLHLVKPGLQRLDSFEALATRLLVKDPTGRPASAGDVVDAIVSLKNDAFPDISLHLEDMRQDCPAVVSMFAEALPQPVQVSGAPGETMAFEGLSEAVARMIEVQEAAARESSPQPESEAGQKTEAFDASFIASVVEQAAAGADIGDAISDARARAADGAEPAGAAPAAKMPAPSKPEKPAKKDKASKKTGKTAVAPAVAQPRPAPTSQVQSMKKKPAGGGRKGGAVIVVVVLALAVLLAIGAAIWWKSRQASSASLPETVSSVAVDRERQASEARRGQANEQVARGRVALDGGDLAGAEAAAAEALRIDAGLPEALKLRSDMMAAKAAAAAAAPVAPVPEPPPVDQEAVAVPATPAPAEPAVAAQTPRSAPTLLRPRRSKIQPTSVTALKPPADAVPVVDKAPAPEPAADPRAEANALRASARAAYKAGDCARTVSLLEKIKALGQFNTLDAGIMKKCASNPE